MPFLTFSKASYLRTVRASAAYDLAVTWIFALPWTFVWIYGLLQGIATSIGAPGEFTPLTPGHVLMANLLGSVVIVWSLARWLAPSVLMGRLDALARTMFALCQIYALTQGVSTIILAFTLFEVFFGLLQMAKVSDAKL